MMLTSPGLLKWPMQPAFSSCAQMDHVPPYVQVASCTWFLYDYLLNFNEEVEFIWTQGRRRTTTTYVATKIVTVVALAAGCLTISNERVSSDNCLRLATFLGIAGFIVTAYADLLLTFRLHYMYNCDRRLLAFNLIIYAIVVISSILINVLNFPSARDYFSPSSGAGSCMVRLRPQMAASWLVGMVFQIYLSILALAKVRKAHAQQKVLGGRVSLLALLVQGNLQYYVVIVAAYCATTVLTLRLPYDQSGSYNLLTVAAMGIFGPKLFRDMRRMLLNSGGCDPTFSTIQPLEFGSTARAQGSC